MIGSIDSRRDFLFNMKLLLVSLCVWSLAMAAMEHESKGSPNAPLEVTPSPAKAGEPGLRYCGRKIATVLYLLCSNNSDSEGNYLGSQYGDSIDGGDRSALGARRGRSAGAAGRARRSVIEDCCYSICTLQDLLAYC